jgi:flagellar motor switch protein FliM
MWTAVLQEQVMETEVDIRVDLGETEITLKELMGLKAGDVISLDQEANGEFDIQVEGTRKFMGYYGVSHGSVAMQVTRRVMKE